MSHERQALRAFNAAASALLVCLSIPAFAGPPWKVDDGFPTDWPTVQVKVTQLTSHLYLLHGSGSNTVASIGPDGTLLVDSEFAPVAPKLKLALDALGAKPVRVVIDTHYHPDHSGGNGAFSRDGAIVVAQENTRTRLLASQYSYYWGRANNPPPPESLPTMTFDRALTLHFNGEEIKLIHNRPAHTDTDAIVYFRSSNVVLMGDLFLMGLYPYIDIQARGTIDGYFPALDEVLDMIDDKTKVVPGHGPVADRAQLKAYRDMLKTVRDRVAGQVSQGASLEQIIASHPSQEFDDAWASNRVGPEGFVAMIYQSLTGKRFEWQPDQPDPPPTRNPRRRLVRTDRGGELRRRKRFGGVWEAREAPLLRCLDPMVRRRLAHGGDLLHRSQVSAMVLDLLPDNHLDVKPAALLVQITAWRDAVPTVA